MARPKQQETMDIVSVRIPRYMLAEIAEYIEDIKEEMPLLNIGQADGIRQLIADGLTYRELKSRKKHKS